MLRLPFVQEDAQADVITNSALVCPSNFTERSKTAADASANVGPIFIFPNLALRLNTVHCN